VKSVLTVILLSVLCWLCIQAAGAMREARRWGAYVAISFGVLLLLFAGSIIHDMYHPEHQVNDEGYALLLVPFIAGIGFWWCVYLNLPRVRARFASNDSR
jgi:cytochrome bd-type quinol oxidase subunit 2